MITLDDAKLHLRVDHDGDDDYIASLIAAARVFITRDLARNLYDTGAPIPADDAHGLHISADLRHAARLLIGNWYEHREAATDAPKTEVPHAYWRLVQHYRLYGV